METKGQNIIGLVFAGGGSKRMGTDKGRLRYGEVEERIRMYNMLKALCGSATLSIRQEQASSLPDGIPTLIDEMPHEGPLVALAAALRHFKQPLLTVPTDVPALTLRTLESLLNRYTGQSDALLCATSAENIPEPLIGIWQPESLRILQPAVDTGERSIVKLFPQLNIHTFVPEHPEELKNINDPEERKRFENTL